MSCVAACPLEAVSLDVAVSPGVVKDYEILYRSIFTEHIGDKSKIRKKALNNKELLAHDTLSFWRAYGESSAEVQLAEDKLRANTPSSKVLAKKFRPTVRAIRELRTNDGNRMFCVVDDVRIDDDGGTDPLHAGIRLCLSLMPLNADDPVYISARDSLLVALEPTAADLATSA